MPTKTITIDSLTPRILLIAFGLLSLVLVFFAAKWFFGNSISMRVFQKEVAEFSVGLAPNDPQTHFALGTLYDQSIQPEDFPKSLVEYEKAVALSPNDYRLWLAYGKAKERNGDSAGAEKALLKALELAPNYAEVHWVYGNILLRQDKTIEAFASIRKAVDSDPKYASPAATTAWDIFDGDIEKVKESIGDSISVRSSLATFLSGQKRFEQAMEIWNGLPENDRKTTFRTAGENILAQLTAGKKYRLAVQLKSQLAQGNVKKISVGQVDNGGFEDAISNETAEMFEWEIAKGNQPKIGPNIEQKHGGEKSLALIFNSPMGKDFRTISQTIAVESGKTYDFNLFYKSNLETSATMKWEIADVVTGKILISTSSIEKNTDWKNLSANFTTPEDSEGIVIRLVRDTCTSSDCSVSGSVWFDDISLN